jgi:hypothetical protein
LDALAQQVGSRRKSCKDPDANGPRQTICVGQMRRPAEDAYARKLTSPCVIRSRLSCVFYHLTLPCVTWYIAFVFFFIQSAVVVCWCFYRRG